MEQIAYDVFCSELEIGVNVFETMGHWWVEPGGQRVSCSNMVPVVSEPPDRMLQGRNWNTYKVYRLD